MKVKLFHKENKNAWLLCVLMLVISLIAWPWLPEQIPIHFNAAGAVDGTGSRFMIFMEPGLTAFLLLLAEVSPRIDPKGANYSRFRRQYHQVHFVVTLLLLLTELYTIAVCFRPELAETFSMGIWMPALVGALLAFCGNIMPKFKHNYFTGIKTPWTLADENVWYRTHRFSGKLYVICGGLMMPTAFLPSAWKVGIFFLLILTMVLVPILYSYLIFRRRAEAGSDENDSCQENPNNPGKL